MIVTFRVLKGYLCPEVQRPEIIVTILRWPLIVHMEYL